MPYLGNEPAVAYTSTTKDTFSGDGSTTDFTMSKSANVNAVRVVVENVVQNPTVAYTCSGTTLSFTSAPPTGTSNIYVVHLGPPAATIAPPTTINNATTFTGGVTLKNETAEDTDGGRESIVTFQGTQSGNEITTLAQIQASHDGTSDDEKGDLIFKTNDGSDGASPTEVMRLDSGGTVNISSPSNARAIKMQNGANNSASQITFLSDDGTEDSFIRNQSSTTGTDILSFGTGGSEHMRIDSNGAVTKTSQPAFLGFRSSQLNNLSLSTLVTMSFATEVFDQNADFDGTTFTAPVLGRYMFSVSMRLEDIDAAATYYQVHLVTSNRDYRYTIAPKFASDPAYSTLTTSVLADMDASDTAVVKVFQSGGTSQTDVHTESFFSGFLAC